MKKLLSLSLAVLILLSTFTFAASAVTPGDGQSILTAKQLNLDETYNLSFVQNWEGLYYKMNIKETEKITLNFESLSGYEPDIRIYDCYGNLIVSFWGGSTLYYADSCTFALSKGDYYIYIGHVYCETPDLKLSFNVIPIKETFPETYIENNNDQFHANKIELNNTYEGVIGADDDRDVYKLNVKENGTRIQLKFVDYLEERTVVLLDENYQEIEAKHTPEETTTPIEFTLDEGVNYIRIWDGSVCNRYRFKIYEVLDEPEKLKATNTDSGIEIQWHEVPNATSYALYRWTGKTWKKIGTTSSTSLTDKTAEKGKEYTYTVKALNKFTESDYGNNCIDSCRLVKPTVKVTHTANTVKLSWNKVPGADGYYVYKKSGKTWAVISSTYDLTETFYTDETVKNGSTCSYMVQAYSRSFGTVKGVKSSIVKTVHLSQAKISSVKASKKSFTATWKKNSSASGYEIQYSTSSKFTSGKTKTATVKSGKTVSKTLKSLKGGQKYYVRVRAYTVKADVRYNSVWSSAKSVTVKK